MLSFNEHETETFEHFWNNRLVVNEAARGPKGNHTPPTRKIENPYYVFHFGTVNVKRSIKSLLFSNKIKLRK